MGVPQFSAVKGVPSSLPLGEGWGGADAGRFALSAEVQLDSAGIHTIKGQTAEQFEVGATRADGDIAFSPVELVACPEVEPRLVALVDDVGAERTDEDTGGQIPES